MSNTEPKRSMASALLRGFRQSCPACGHAPLYHSFLKTHDQCAHCGTPLSAHEADDAPPYFTIFIVGHVVIPIALLVERFYAPPLWVFACLFSVLALVTALLALPRVKGAIIGWQWALGMHGFAPNSDETAQKQ